MILKIAVDFDGTCTTHEFPKVGRDIGAVPVLKKLVEQGHKLILHTMRGTTGEYGNTLIEAANWFRDNNIKLYSVQKDLGQYSWTDSPKCYANLYIDDAALGCPLVYPEGQRPYVDWEQVEKMLYDKGILND